MVFNVLIFMFFVSSLQLTYSANILAVWTMPPASPSVTFGYSAITRALLEKGHNITLLSETNKGTLGFPNGSFSQAMMFKATYDKEKHFQFLDNMIRFSQRGVKEWSDLSSLYEYFTFTRQAVANNCFDLVNDKDVMRALKNSDFDLVIVVPFAGCDALLPRYVNAPFVTLVTTIRLFAMNEGTIGMPYPSAYVPFNLFTTLTDEMSFFQRIQNLLGPVFFWTMNYFLMRPLESPVLRSAFEVPSERNIRDMFMDTTLFLAHTGVGTDFPRPMTPNFIPIGGLLAKPGKPVPEDLATFLDGSGDDGFILFTLGSVAKGLFNKKLAESFASVFKKLPQRVLWRHAASPPENLGENTKIVEWLPQNDVLAHPKIKLFIYHGGSNGVYEGVYHGVPMVILPVMGDQFTHAARIKRKGMGLMLDMSTMTEDEFLQSITEVIQNPTYRERTKHFSAIHRDAPMTPLDTAIYWIEHVLKFGGDHLRPASADMSTMELYMIDVGVFLLAVLSVEIYIGYLILKKCFSCCCGKKDTEKKKRE